MTDPASRTPTIDVLTLAAIDEVWERVRRRVSGLSQAEYLWEPVPDCWSVREVEGRVIPDWSGDDPDPAPFTTIAWRLHHLSADCFANYVTGGFGPWPMRTPKGEWTLEVGEALELFDQAWAGFRSAMGGLGATAMWQPLGPGWGPYVEHSRASLVLHAMDELAHHGAEIALLRDLWRFAPNCVLRPID